MIRHGLSNREEIEISVQDHRRSIPKEELSHILKDFITRYHEYTISIQDRQ
jgi:signal transduction histidine kinase